MQETQAVVHAGMYWSEQPLTSSESAGEVSEMQTPCSHEACTSDSRDASGSAAVVVDILRW